MTNSDGEPLRNHSADGWKERIIVPTIIAGAVGAAAGLVSKNRMSLGAVNVSAAYASNMAIVAACYCGAREVARDARKSEPDDLINSAVGGFTSGALLGRLQGGQFGAIRYSVIFAVVGTAFDFTTLKLTPILQHFIRTASEVKSQKNDGSSSSWWRIPEWSPIQILDEEALAAKRAREQKIYAQRVLSKLEEES
ncbi:uncharacterized protein LOC110034165 [Phalaenopsis equestris]|uniref:uncharacterized protein LOC110034165 n=1 Tax=Phalaenopsis equestris TaxID=78828 RepID=UPI0009E5D58D|nr:uncharacterized protein LOC110034165 [Phalaenopsis equestris]